MRCSLAPGSSGTCFGSSSVKPCVRNVPNTATPTVAPICRLNCPMLVATPISVGGAEFWITRLNSVCAGPRPMPVSASRHARSALVVSGPMPVSATTPAISTMPPPTMKGL